MLCYKERVSIITVSGQYTLDSRSNSYVAINNGDTLVKVNQCPLKPPILPTLSGESSGVVGNADEIFLGDNGVISIAFLPPIGTNPSVIIKEKYYVLQGK